MIDILRWALFAAELWAGWSVLYLCILSVAAILRARNPRFGPTASCSSPRSETGERHGATDGSGQHASFAIIVPAHNEELLLGKLLDNLHKLHYPVDNYTVFVVADNCTDNTAALARAHARVHVYERFDTSRRGKGYALNWMFERLNDDGLAFDAYIVIDADAVVNAGFLQAMNRELAGGAQALQGHNTVLNTVDSPGTTLRWIALTLMNHVRPLGRNAIGGSSTLTGTGMCLSREILQRFPWQAYALGEDYQYYLQLVQHGVRVRYVPDAVVRSEMPRTFASMRSQDIRWESQSSNEAGLGVAWRMFVAGLRHRDFVRLDAIAEMLTPPLSLLAGWALVTLIASLLLQSLPNVLLAAALVGGVAFYVGTGVSMLRPSRAVIRGLLYAPLFMLWKLWVHLVASRSRGRTSEWVRTSRNA